MNEIMPVLSDAMVAILIALLSLLSAYAVRWVNAATVKAHADTLSISDEQLRRFAQEAITRVDDLSTKTVTQIEQTTAGTLREMVKDGRATIEELEALGQRAVEEVLVNLSPLYREALTETVGNLREYVTKTVESKVYELKHGFLPGATIELVE